MGVTALRMVGVQDPLKNLAMGPNFKVTSNSQLEPYYIAAIRPLFGCYSATVRPIYAATIRTLYAVTIRLLYGHYTPLFGRYTATIRSLYGL